MDTNKDILGEYNKVEKLKKNKKGEIVKYEYYNFCYAQNNFITHFILKNQSAKFKFFYCFKRGLGCEAENKYEKEDDKFNVYQECDFKINHENYNYEQFEQIYNNNTFDKIDFTIKLYQRYYIRALFKNNEIIDKFSAIEKFKLKFGSEIKFLLNDNDIAYEKSIAFKINDSDLESLIKNLYKEFDNFLYKTIDVNYECNYFHKTTKKYYKINREEKLIFFGLKNMYENFINNDIKQFFIDITYKIIPNKFKPYKLLTIKGFDAKNLQIVLCGLVCIKYEDSQSLYYAFKYLKDFFKFTPKIVNIDFSLVLSNALLSPNLFDEKPIIVNCFFILLNHYIKK